MRHSTKQLRRIVVDHQEFHWKADWEYRGEYKDLRIIKLRIWQAQGRGITLRINLKRKPPLLSDNSYVTPKDVASIIKFALVHGWQPESHGAPFWLKCVGNLELDDLVIAEEVNTSESMTNDY